MSHPMVGHDYSERSEDESKKEYKKRKHTALSKALGNKKTPRASATIGKWASDLGAMMDSKLPHKEWMAKYGKK